jgi:hypothetical protein
MARRTDHIQQAHSLTRAGNCPPHGAVTSNIKEVNILIVCAARRCSFKYSDLVWQILEIIQENNRLSVTVNATSRTISTLRASDRMRR